MMKNAKGSIKARPLLAALRPTAGFAQPAACGGATQAARLPAPLPAQGRWLSGSLRGSAGPASNGVVSR
ncbi:MAG: hypothetical protein RugAbin2_00706 [Rugosibacter sp.]|jgi:hypothetical protein|nr:hypothetical protein [Rugosibacter sp.]